MTQFRTRLTLPPGVSPRGNDRIRLRNRRLRNRVPFKPFYLFPGTAGQVETTDGIVEPQTIDYVVQRDAGPAPDVQLVVDGVATTIPSNGSPVTISVSAGDTLALRKPAAPDGTGVVEIEARTLSNDILFRTRIEFV